MTDIERDYLFVKRQLNNQASVVCYADVLPYQFSYDINYKGDSFKILRIKKHLYFSNWVSIFDMKQINPNETLELFVPKHFIHLVLGENDTNIKKWAQLIGVKRIQVIPI